MENMARVAAFNREKQTKNLLNKYGINSDFYDNIKVTSKCLTIWIQQKESNIPL